MTIAVENLSHHYGRLHALRDVNATATSGRITTLLGPNAAGKSTLLRCIIGAIKPTSGLVRINSHVAHAMPPYKLAQCLAYVPQRSTVAAAFTVREVIELGRYMLPRRPSRVNEAIKRMQLNDIADRPYASLSVGQQQRVTLARALAQLNFHAPASSHLVLDEPMSAMDLRHVRDTIALLRELAHQGIAVIMAIHDLTLAASIADDVWLLNDGRMAAGPASKVLTTDQLEYVYGVGFQWVNGRLLTT